VFGVIPPVMIGAGCCSTSPGNIKPDCLRTNSEIWWNSAQFYWPCPLANAASAEKAKRNPSDFIFKGKRIFTSTFKQAKIETENEFEKILRCVLSEFSVGNWNFAIWFSYVLTELAGNHKWWLRESVWYQLENLEDNKQLQIQKQPSSLIKS
jgi:hypothetical protein